MIGVDLISDYGCVIGPLLGVKLIPIGVNVIVIGVNAIFTD